MAAAADECRAGTPSIIGAEIPGNQQDIGFPATCGAAVMAAVKTIRSLL